MNEGLVTVLPCNDLDGTQAFFVQAPEHKPWGMYEFSLNAPDDSLVRVRRPSGQAA